ncbi:hypothetical protein HPP92_024052 [Vanilla planifolia]|uniref:Aspartate aminotransferase n=1 Tax=Vanilla planifolia TaxID=51239 RepID=A0A835PIZ6_VANPL|nr:hypothetical protein HPP92_024052 [Vanilla planifolia]
MAIAICRGIVGSGRREAASWRRFMSTSSWWDHVEPAAKDPILGVTEAFLADPSPEKVNVGVGAYRDDDGKPVVLECVREAERRIAGNLNMEYLPMGGSIKMIEESLKLAYGEDSELIKDKHIAAIQALSGTGACRVFADFQRRFLPDSQIYIPVPTWANHHNIWRDAHVSQRTFHYYHPETRGLDFAAMMDDIKNAPNGSFFLLHACAHNPTGVDPSEDQWREISYQFKVKNHFPFFDMAYQGFASGDPERDAKAIRIFLDDGHMIGCAQSYAKNMGLYGQRVGCLSLLCENEIQAVSVKSQLQQIARPMYSNPPVHGALVVSIILSDPELKAMWLKEVKIGMFCYSGLKPDQVDRLTNEFHIYMTRNGRISMAGVTTGNVGYLANAIHEVTKPHEPTTGHVAIQRLARAAPLKESKPSTSELSRLVDPWLPQAGQEAKPDPIPFGELFIAKGFDFVSADLSPSSPRLRLRRRLILRPFPPPLQLLHLSCSGDGEAKPKSQSGIWNTVKPFANGGASGMLATCVIQPVDMIKVRIQLGQGSAAQVTKNMLAQEGFWCFL